MLILELIVLLMFVNDVEVGVVLELSSTALNVFRSNRMFTTVDSGLFRQSMSTDALPLSGCMYDEPLPSDSPIRAKYSSVPREDLALFH